MNVAENMLLQVQGMASLPKTGSTGAKDKTGSFQDLMDQAGKDSVDTGKEPKDPSTTDQPANSEKTEGESAPKAPVQKKDGQKVDETQIDPNAVLLTMFRRRRQLRSRRRPRLWWKCRWRCRRPRLRRPRRS